MKILVAGGGNMGKTFAQGFLNSKLITREELFIFEKDSEKIKQLNDEGLGTAFSDENEYFENADIYILAVKPQDFKNIFSIIKKYITDDKIVISIMAGINMDHIKKNTGATKVVRTMPNLACQVGKGVIGYKISKDMSATEKELVENLLKTTALALEVDDEKKLDAVTAMSGSGPAYVFYFMDAMIQAGIQLGFNLQEASEIVLKTFEGSIQLLNSNNLSPREWINKVASKGGTTEVALETFEDLDVKNSIGKGILRAENRSEELSKG
ncbi:MAG: pyrroline-5-carboxylate reductase [Chitinophagales bacterium]|nr:pyrroline-5-carboxylate reductase [Chitinophagales bacterium]